MVSIVCVCHSFGEQTKGTMIEVNVKSAGGEDGYGRLKKKLRDDRRGVNVGGGGRARGVCVFMCDYMRR